MFFVAAGLFMLALVPPCLQQQELCREVDKLTGEQEQLQLERQRLEQEKEYFSSDAYVEQVARQELGLVRPGEVVVVRAKPGNALPLKKEAALDTTIRD